MGNIYDEGNLKLSDKDKFDKISNLISKENYCSVCIVSFLNYNKILVSKLCKSV